MILKHRAGGKDWAGVELPDDPGMLVASIPGVTPTTEGGLADWGKCAHLIVMGIREEQNRIVAQARKNAGKKKLDAKGADAAVAKALTTYAPGCSYKPRPTALEEAMKMLKKAKVPMSRVLQAATEEMRKSERTPSQETPQGDV